MYLSKRLDRESIQSFVMSIRHVPTLIKKTEQFFHRARALQVK